MEQGARKQRVGVDLYSRPIFCAWQAEPFLQNLFRKPIFAAKLVHRSEMKEKLIHLFHPYQAESEFARTLEVEDCFRCGEPFYSQNRGSHHGAERELLGVAFRCLGLLLHKFETGLKQAHRFAMGAAKQGLFPGEPEVADRARAIAAIPEMTGELIRVRSEERRV